MRRNYKGQVEKGTVTTEGSILLSPSNNKLEMKMKGASQRTAVLYEEVKQKRGRLRQGGGAPIEHETMASHPRSHKKNADEENRAKG